MIDAHVHLKEDNSHEEALHLINEMDNSNIDKAIVIALPGVASNKYVLGECKKHDGRLYGMVYPEFPKKDMLEKLKRCVIDTNCVGIKIHPRIQNIELDDSRVNSIFEFANLNNIPVVVDMFAWGKGLNLKSTHPSSLQPIAEKFTNVPIVVAHAGGHHILEAVLLAKSYKNIYVDISLIIKYFENFKLLDDLVPICKKIGCNRVVYGSDYPQYSLKNYLSATHSCLQSLSQSEKKLIFNLNAMDIFGI